MQHTRPPVTGPQTRTWLRRGRGCHCRRHLGAKPSTPGSGLQPPLSPPPGGKPSVYPVNVYPSLLPSPGCQTPGSDPVRRPPGVACVPRVLFPSTKKVQVCNKTLPVASGIVCVCLREGVRVQVLFQRVRPLLSGLQTPLQREDEQNRPLSFVNRLTAGTTVPHYPDLPHRTKSLQTVCVPRHSKAFLP